MQRAVLRTAVIVTAAFWVLAGCGQKPAKQVGMSAPDPSPLKPGTSAVKPGTIGTLTWEIYDTRSQKVVSQGERDFTVDDVKIEQVSDLFTKEIDLGDHFRMGIAGSPDGFALTGTRDDVLTFSWDWFTVDRSGRATKLQEPGELAVETVSTPNGLEISRVEFLTDVSIRVSRMTDSDPLDPEWRIKVFKGSVIVWPALVNGTVSAQ